MEIARNAVTIWMLNMNGTKMETEYDDIYVIIAAIRRTNLSRITNYNKKTMNKTKISERLRLAIAKSENKVEFKKELAANLWPNANELSRGVNVSRLINGRQKQFTLEQIETICKTLNVTPNYLFGYEEENI